MKALRHIWFLGISSSKGSKKTYIGSLGYKLGIANYFPFPLGNKQTVESTQSNLKFKFILSTVPKVHYILQYLSFYFISELKNISLYITTRHKSQVRELSLCNSPKIHGLQQVFWFQPPIISWTPSYETNILDFGIKQQSHK